MAFRTPSIYLAPIRAISLLVPGPFRSDWRREWEAEIVNHWIRLQAWERLNARTRFDLFKRLQGAFWDALWFQQRRTWLLLVTLNLLVASLTGFGAGQQFVSCGIGNRQTQPFLIGLAGVVVSILVAASGIAMLRSWFAWRRLATITGALSVLLHVYGALPPHRNIGLVALIVGAGYGLVLLLVARRAGEMESV